MLSASIRYRTDDFDDGVHPAQPLLGTGLPDEAAFTPGDQLGLLDDDSWQVGLDAFFTPSERLSWNVFANLEQADSLQLGATFEILPEKLTLRFDSSASLGRVELAYRGFGVTNFDGTPFPDDHQFAFRSPPTVRHDFYEADARLEIRLRPDVDLTLGYLYDRYRIRDWQQEDETPWFESVGSPFLLRDTSRSHQWGNRLVNLGSSLAPGYDGSLGYVLLGFRF